MDTELRPAIQFNFSRRFDATVWNTVMVPNDDILLVETRDSIKKKASFSALSLQTGHFLWQNIAFDEPWWITLSAASNDMALFTIYTETNNPDRKGIFAYNIRTQQLSWWNNDFSLTKIIGDSVVGMTSKYGTRQLVLDARTGLESLMSDYSADSPSMVLKPVQYADDQSHFNTIKTFLTAKFNLLPVIALEYLEFKSLILISFYVAQESLTNYLMILSGDGITLLQEKLDGPVKGIGLDTFFIYSGCVFFVKNKEELFSYKIV